MWGLGLGSLALGLVNGALVISAGIGLVAYQQLLALSPRQRQGLMQRLQQGLPLPATPKQQAFMLGLLAGASTYTFTALWHSTHSLLMALLLTGQGALALYALGALLRSPQSANQSTSRSDDLWDAAPVAQVEHNLALLSHSDPLKRLVAVRRLVRLAQTDAEYLVGVSVRSHLLDCFALRLGQESDVIVRSALEEGQNLLQPVNPLPPSAAVPFDAGFGDAELHNLELEPQPGAAAYVAGSPNLSQFPSESRNLAVSLGQNGLERPSENALEEPPGSSTTAPTHGPNPSPRGRRAVEYVEYLDI